MLGAAVTLGVGLALAPVATLLVTSTPAAAVGTVATVTGVSPVSGAQPGGNTVTITGTNLGTTGTTTVHFGAVSATNVTVSADGSSLTATAPANPNIGLGSDYGSTYDVTVNNGNGFSATSANDRYTYEYDSTTCGSGNNASCAATISAQETAPLTGSVVNGPGTVQVPVNATITLDANTTTDTTGSNYGLSIIDASTVPPTILAHVGDSGTTHPELTTTVHMSSAGQARYVAEVDMCGTPPTFPSPPTVGCPLTTIGGNSDAVVAQWSPPTVTSVSPSTGVLAGGTSVTVNGSNLAGATAVNFGGSPGTNVVVNGGGTSLTVTSPAASTGTVDITVLTAAGLSGTSSADHFTYAVTVPPPLGYWMVGTDGGVFAFGGAPYEGSLPADGVHVKNIVSIVPTSSGHGYWMIGSDGGVFAFGDAGFVGSLPGLNVHVSNIVGAVPTSSGHGYWMVGSDGGVFAFGDAGFVGSLPGLNVHVKNVVAVVPTSSGHGYWMIGSDGGVFAFGDAGFVGSLPGLNVHVNNVVGAVPTSSGRGYWMVGTDGGVFAFGDAGFVGSLPGLNVHVSNIVGVVSTPTDLGYWMVGRDGGVFAFGDASFVGSIPGLGVHVSNIVGFARQ